MFQKGVALKRFSSIRIGGKARWLADVASVDELTGAVEKAHTLNAPLFIIGGGTNLLLNDDGLDGIVVRPAFEILKTDGVVVTVGAGVLMADLIEFAIANKLSGLEWAGGLPGTVGGAVRGNAGAFSGEIKDSVMEVTSFDVASRAVIKRARAYCRFGYRTSVFKEASGGEIILWAKLRLAPGDKRQIRDRVEEKIAYRHARHPMEHPNIGSIFKNVDVKSIPRELIEELQAVIKGDPIPVVPTAYLIATAGLAGVSSGGAMISPKHPNFIVNVLDATARDVKSLITLVKSEVFFRFNILLEEEVQVM